MAHGRRVRQSGFGWRFWCWGTLALLLASLLGAALAMPARAAEADDAWRVGRLAATQGRVWLRDRNADPDPGQPSELRDGRDAERWHDSSTEPLSNWPLGRGDLLRTGVGARATVQFDTLTLRLGADTELRIEQLDAARLVLWLPRGDLALHVLADPAPRAIELRTPEGRLWPLRVGHYRASRVHDSTQATAWAGEWRFDASDSALNVPEGQRADFWLAGRPPRTHFDWVGVDRDAFAAWARHDAHEDRALAAPPELAGLPGAAELQRWGDWRDDADAGRVWIPRELPLGWAPYRDGRWVWVSPWGWTWVDAAPWGFAPFHYGQWVMTSGRWAWAPGPRVERRRYVPVLPGWGHAVPRHVPPRFVPGPAPHWGPRPPVALPPTPQPLPAPAPAPRAELPRREPPRAEPPRAEPPRHDTPRTERLRQEPPRHEFPPGGPPRLEGPRPPGVVAPPAPAQPRPAVTAPPAAAPAPAPVPSPAPAPAPAAAPPGARPAPALRPEPVRPPRDDGEPRRGGERNPRSAPP